MSGKEPKKYKETLKEELYSKVYTKMSKDGEKEFPVNKIKVNLYEYSGEYKDKDGELVEYNGEKVKIINTKLVIEDGEYVNAKKSINGKVYNDETMAVMSGENFADMIESFK